MESKKRTSSKAREDKYIT